MEYRLPAAILFSLSGAALAQTPTVHLEILAKGMPSQNPGIFHSFDTYAQLTIAARVDPPVGTAITLPNGTAGTIAGLCNVWLDLVACDATNSQWTLSGTGFQGSTGTTWGIRSGWTSGGSAGTVQSDGSLLNIAAGQFVFPGDTANATNPVAEIWRGRWVPSSFSSSNATHFTIQPHSVSVYIRTGTGPGGEPVYTTTVAKPEPTATLMAASTGGPPPSCTPFISISPSIITLTPGDAAIINASVTQSGGPCPPMVFQWRRVCSPVIDNSRISGAQSSTLRISHVVDADAGFYNLSVNNWKWGNAVRLKVSGCYANCDRSTGAPTLSANDFQCFINKFAAGDAYANCDLSTATPALTPNDFQCFINRYASGCR